MGLIRHNLPTIIVLTLIFGVVGCGVLWLFLWQRVGFLRAGVFAAMIGWTGLLFSLTIVPKRKFGGTDLPRACTVSVVPDHVVGALTNERRLAALLLFVPLAIMLVLAARGVVRVALAGVLLALPFLVESVQYLLPGLHRACASQDVYDAWLGLFGGLVVGAVALSVLRRWSVVQPVRARHRDPNFRPNPADLVKVLWPPLEETPAVQRPTLPPPKFVPSGARDINGRVTATKPKPEVAPRHIADPRAAATPGADGKEPAVD